MSRLSLSWLPLQVQQLLVSDEGSDNDGSALMESKRHVVWLCTNAARPEQAKHQNEQNNRAEQSTLYPESASAPLSLSLP